MTGQPTPKPLINIGGAPKSLEAQSASAQSSVATMIVVGLIILAGLSIWEGASLAMHASTTTDPHIALAIGGAIGGLISIASTVVGGLVNALVSPSGIASVLSAARQGSDQLQPNPQGTDHA